MTSTEENAYSEGVKITEVTSAQTLNAGASLLVTQPESGKESLRRVPLDVAGFIRKSDGAVILSLERSDNTLTLNRSPAAIFSLYENAAKTICRFEYSGILIDLAVAAVDKTENALYLSSIHANRVYSVVLQEAEANAGSMSGFLKIKDLASEDDLSTLAIRVNALENLTNLDEVSF